MTTATHTQWEAREDTLWENGGIIASFRCGNLLKDDQDDGNNENVRRLRRERTRLAADAPELLEACNRVHDIINNYSHIPAMFDACQILQSAIKKATGKGEA